MCRVNIKKYKNCACKHEWVVPCDRVLFLDSEKQNQIEQGSEESSPQPSRQSSWGSNMGDEELIEHNKPNVIHLFQDHNPKKWNSCLAIEVHVPVIELVESGPCPPCQALIRTGANPHGKKDVGQKMVRDSVVVEVPLNLGKREVERTPRSFYYVHRRKYIVDEEGNEHLEALKEGEEFLTDEDEE
ncbi:hypothetical protein B0T20DRAFT_485337 [Sordaria brevicollis]|uniref:Uncharacterized protein n=1 Tax=Sordaria brevicollis TaxID=83679 RepID=A0AAE0UFS0_SORBR|nr:hypothetical protein B0T20DRAFT_485337 [Sordaria brevicollis]